VRLKRVGDNRWAVVEVVKKREQEEQQQQEEEEEEEEESKDVVLAEYADEDLRQSVVYRARCFADAAWREEEEEHGAMF